MKKIILLVAIIALNISALKIFAQGTANYADSIGWQLCAQAWTFHNFNFSNSLDKMKEAGIKYVEMFPGQEIGGGIAGNNNFSMDKETRDKVLALIQSKGLKLVNYGVVGAKTEEEWNKLFEFAKAMGIQTIVTEADSMQLNYIEPLCVKYGIFIALHNHPKPSKYWSPDYTMQQIANRNKYIGICADFGHWVRSGLNPIESLQKCKGRILSIHAKDLIPAQGAFNGYHDVPWGTGTSNFAGMMWELKNQGYKGTFTVEYEYNWDKSLPEVKESAAYFYRLAYWLNKK
jgi:sugar phosphate isomerase/epimerase